jgi:hypothetical protein
MAGMGDRMRAMVQEHVPEPVISVGVLQPAGTWGGMGGDQLSGVLGSVMRRNANKRSGGLGKNSAFRTKIAMVAVTEQKLYAFNAKGWGMKTTITDTVGEWDRDDVKVTVTPGTMSTQFVFDVVSTGDHYELETNAIMGLGGFTKEFVAALGASAPAEDAGDADAAPADD